MNETAVPTTLTYMPLPDDSDETKFGGMTFRAYEPVTLTTPEHLGVAERLRGNAWFTLGAIDDGRHEAWKRVRDAQAAAKLHHGEAERITKEART